MSRPSIFNTYCARNAVSTEREHLRREYRRAVARREYPYARIVLNNLRALASTTSTG